MWYYYWVQRVNCIANLLREWMMVMSVLLNLERILVVNVLNFEE